ncbi:MAG: cysteine--tRNA ligase [Candidatus Fimenecus sp.]
MKIYNTLTRKKEEFKELEKGKVRLYVCGPTVYNYIHIGNARPLCVFDTFRKYLEFRGYEVKYVSNFTDIDDKIIRRANEENSDYKTVSEKYIKEFEIDARGLNTLPATVQPKATENIDGMIALIEKLIANGNAYPAENGDVYFKPRSDKSYGKLSHQNIDDLEAGARIAKEEVKNDPMDFALWKGAKPGEPFWESPWGKGRPGWHIECSVMAEKYLGKTIDIHGGGQDLIFPHHENEIAQSECANGCTFSNYFMHNGYINVDNVKMSKSLGNFFTVRDVAEKYGYEPIRYLMISSHYRMPVNYSFNIIEQCIASLKRLHNCKNAMLNALETANGKAENKAELFDKINSHREKFISVMDDDLNTADGLTAIFELVRLVNTEILKTNDKELISRAFELFNTLTEILGIVYEEKTDNPSEKTEEDKEIDALVEKRNEYRKNKDFENADKIRDELKSRGIILEDTKDGVKWKRI